MNFSIRKGDVELRSCDTQLTSGNTHDRAEIVVWEKGAGEYCYTVAHFCPDKEGFYLKTVLDRPMKLDTNEYEGFLLMMKVGFSLLYTFWDEEGE